MQNLLLNWHRNISTTENGRTRKVQPSATAPRTSIPDSFSSHSAWNSSSLSIGSTTGRMSSWNTFARTSREAAEHLPTNIWQQYDKINKKSAKIELLNLQQICSVCMTKIAVTFLTLTIKYTHYNYLFSFNWPVFCGHTDWAGSRAYGETELSITTAYMVLACDAFHAKNQSWSKSTHVDSSPTKIRHRQLRLLHHLHQAVKSTHRMIQMFDTLQ